MLKSSCLEVVEQGLGFTPCLLAPQSQVSHLENNTLRSQGGVLDADKVEIHNRLLASFLNPSWRFPRTRIVLTSYLLGTSLDVHFF